MSLPIDLTAPAVVATDTNYTNGSAAGTPTKTNPGAALTAEGLMPGRNGAQHLNWHFNALGVASGAALAEARRSIYARALVLRRIGADNAFADTGNGIGVVGSGLDQKYVILAKGGATDTRRVWFGGDDADVRGSIASITSEVVGMARNGSRIVAIGAGGNGCCFSTNYGASWTAGSSLGATPLAIVWNATHGVFHVTFASGINANAATDTDGASTWSVVGSGLSGAQGGIAVLSNGVAVMPGTNGSGDVDFSRSTNGGSTWSTIGGTVPDAADYIDGGWIAGENEDTIYHLGTMATTGEFRLCVSTNGTSWTHRSTFTPNDTSSYPERPRLLRCKDTGVMWVVFDQGSGTSTGIIASVDNGETWSEQVTVSYRQLNNFGCAQGRLFSTVGGKLYASDGVLV